MESKKSTNYKKNKKATKKSNPKKYYKKKYNRPLENLGRSLGSYFGSTGSKVGKYLGRAAGIITGSGAYHINKNTLYNQNIPFMHSSSDHIKVRHREFLGNINGSVNFNNLSYNINPGLKNSFPWLSSIAQSFEQYKIEGMVVEFVSTCGDAIASTNNTLGTVCLSTDYNVVNEDFVTMAQAQNSMFSSTGKPSTNIIMPIECDGKLNVLERLFIRNETTNLTNSDLRLYDHCKINISTEGQQISTQIGQLWFSFDISFYKSVLKDQNTNYIAHYYNPSPSSSLPLSVSMTKFFDNIGLTFSSSTIFFNNGLNFVNKKFQVVFMYYNPNYGTTGTIVAPTLSFTNCAGNFILTNGTDGLIEAPTTQLVSGSYISIIEIVITGINATISGFATGSYIPGSSRVDVIINNMY